jgi:hypothetical protein
MSAIVAQFLRPLLTTRGLMTGVEPRLVMESSMSGWKVTFLHDASARDRRMS